MLKAFGLAATAAVAAAALPEQIHLSVTGNSGEMAVDFVSGSDGQTVKFTTGPTFTANCEQATVNKYTAYFCTALMTGLTANTSYTYRVGSDAGGWSQPFTFTSEPASRPYIFAVYADFGFANDESLPDLLKDAQAGGFDYVIHAGDYAYDLDSSNSQVGNNFMNSVQPYAATVPYMGSPGNHEAYGTQGGGNFSQFVLRHRAIAENAGKNSGSNTNLYYSFNTPFVHWVAFTAETWTMSADQIAAQAAWLDKDLSAVDRTTYPWVVAFSHKAFQMDQTTWSLFNFLADHKVDVQFVGHWHQYTRFPPMDTRDQKKVVIDWASISADNNTYTDAQYPTVIVTGAPGDQEVNPRNCTEEYQMNCSGNYGYGHFQVFNATHAHWVWETTVPVKGSPDPAFKDDLWFVKTQ